MPAYDYRCPKCGKMVEEIHGMLENPEIICEKCKTPMKKVITGGSNTIYKSPGFSKWRGMKN